LTTPSTDIAAFTPTSTARAALVSAGTNLDELNALLATHLVEAKRLLTQIIALHPSTGGDSTNYSALVATLAKL
jgi:hypothetical protein